MLVRLMSASALIAVCLVIFAAPNSSAAPARPEAKMTWGVVTGTLYLNKRETAYLSLGSGAVSTFAAALPPPINLVVSSFAAAIAAYAGKVVVDGRCLKIKIRAVPLMNNVWPGSYGPKTKKTGRYCR